MALTGVEAVVLDVIATLRNGMTTELAVLEAEYQDSVALTVPDAAEASTDEIAGGPDPCHKSIRAFVPKE